MQHSSDDQEQANSISERDAGLKRMLDSIEVIPGSNFIVKRTAKQCCWDDVEEVTDRAMEWILENDFEFSEEREMEIKITIEELLLNGGSATGENSGKDIYIEFYFGKKGIVVRIKDQGPGFDYKKALQDAKKSDRQALTREKVLYERDSKDYPGGTGTFASRISRVILYTTNQATK